MMKLYAVKPDGHGSLSFFVLAETEQEARKAVDAKASSLPSHEREGWNDGQYTEEHYQMDVYEPGEVATNPND